MKSQYKFLGIITIGIIVILISYITLNLGGHIVLRDNKVIGYKIGLMDKIKKAWL